MMPKSIYVLGGRQRMDRSREEWHQYDQAVIVRVDIAEMRAEVVKRYVSPPSVAPLAEEPAIVFKSGSVRGNTLYACTQTEVVGFTIPSMEQSHYISLPCFNDVHHVAALQDGDLAVVSTGLDAVFLLCEDGQIKREWSTMPSPIWERFDRNKDYRLVVTTKPHASHPNYCFMLDGALWATRFEQRDAIRLDDPSDRFEIGIERPHDGFVYEGKVYFTTVDGHVMIFDAQTRKRLDTVDLNAISGGGGALGWCRGILPVGDDIFLIGFSRIRLTRFKHTLHWLRHRVTATGFDPNGTEETRIAAYDLRQRKLLWKFSLEAHDLNALFSMHPAPE